MSWSEPETVVGDLTDILQSNLTLEADDIDGGTESFSHIQYEHALWHLSTAVDVGDYYAPRM